MEALGRRFRRPGRVYLVGGTTLVYEGFRAQTLDIHLTYEIAEADHAEFMRTLQELKRALAINIEEASPQEFIPLPAGSQERARFVGRFGQLEIFHFDAYSVALSKIERGQEADFADVLALLKAGWHKFEALQTHFESILPLVGGHSLKADPGEFQRKFSHLERVWLAARG